MRYSNVKNDVSKEINIRNMTGIWTRKNVRYSRSRFRCRRGAMVQCEPATSGLKEYAGTLQNP